MNLVCNVIRRTSILVLWLPQFRTTGLGHPFHSAPMIVLACRSRVRATELCSIASSLQMASASPAPTPTVISLCLALAPLNHMKRSEPDYGTDVSKEQSVSRQDCFFIELLFFFSPRSFRTRCSSTRTTDRWSATPTALCWTSRPSRRHISCPLPSWLMSMETLIHRGRTHLDHISLWVELCVQTCTIGSEVVEVECKAWTLLLES